MLFPLSAVLGRSNRISQNENCCKQSPGNTLQREQSYKKLSCQAGSHMVNFIKILTCSQTNRDTRCFREHFLTTKPIQNYCPQEPHNLLSKQILSKHLYQESTADDQFKTIVRVETSLKKILCNPVLCHTYLHPHLSLCLWGHVVSKIRELTQLKVYWGRLHQLPDLDYCAAIQTLMGAQSRGGSGRSRTASTIALLFQQCTRLRVIYSIY